MDPLISLILSGASLHIEDPQTEMEEGSGWGNGRKSGQGAGSGILSFTRPHSHRVCNAPSPIGGVGPGNRGGVWPFEGPKELTQWT